MYGTLEPSFDAHAIITENASPHCAVGSISAISRKCSRSWHSAVATTVQQLYKRLLPVFRESVAHSGDSPRV